MPLTVICTSETLRFRMHVIDFCGELPVGNYCIY